MLLNVGLTLSIGIIAIVAFGILQWLNIPAGNIVDWLIGIGSFYWLLAIVTIPWNIYFDAREVIAEGAISLEKGIPVDDKQLKYAQKVSVFSLIIAICLHVLSSIGLYLLAYYQITVIGYIGSVAALLFTVLRPSIRAYQYLANRLSNIRKQIKYPREDILELRNRVRRLEQKITKWHEEDQRQKTNQKQEEEQIRKNLANLRATFEQFQATNQVQHQELSKEAQNAISQLTEDSQFLGNVREIIRFIKNA